MPCSKLECDQPTNAFISLWSLMIWSCFFPLLCHSSMSVCHPLVCNERVWVLFLAGACALPSVGNKQHGFDLSLIMIMMLPGRNYTKGRPWLHALWPWCFDVVVAFLPSLFRRATQRLRLRPCDTWPVSVIVLGFRAIYCSSYYSSCCSGCCCLSWLLSVEHRGQRKALILRPLSPPLMKGQGVWRYSYWIAVYCTTTLTHVDAFSMQTLGGTFLFITLCHEYHTIWLSRTAATTVLWGQ